MKCGDNMSIKDQAKISRSVISNKISVSRKHKKRDSSGNWTINSCTQNEVTITNTICFYKPQQKGSK